MMPTSQGYAMVPGTALGFVLLLLIFSSLEKTYGWQPLDFYGGRTNLIVKATSEGVSVQVATIAHHKPDCNEHCTFHSPRGWRVQDQGTCRLSI